MSDTSFEIEKLAKLLNESQIPYELFPLPFFAGEPVPMVLHMGIKMLNVNCKNRLMNPQCAPIEIDGVVGTGAYFVAEGVMGLIQDDLKKNPDVLSEAAAAEMNSVFQREIQISKDISITSGARDFSSDQMARLIDYLMVLEAQMDEEISRFGNTFKEKTYVEVPKGPQAQEYDEKLIQRADAILNGGVSSSEDNPLKLNVDSRLISVDPRLRGFPADSPTFRKTHHCPGKVKEIYDSYPESCQILIYETDDHKNNCTLYDEMRMELINMGVPEKEIDFIHDSVKKDLFKQVNDGKIRILIGSTDKLGVGVNIQRKLKAIQRLSVLWLPSDIEQRNVPLSRALLEAKTKRSL